MANKDTLEIVCSRCRTSLGRGKDLKAACPRCGLGVSRVHDVPVLRAVAEGEKVDFVADAHGLPTLDSSNLPIGFIRDAMASNGLVLELAAGHDVCTAPHLVKTDAYVYSPELDYVADAHCLPFADDTFDFVYSLAAFEHLHTPWIAASEIHRVLKPGGRVYTLAAFFQHVHGYPSHFFNMTEMGLRRVFSGFEILECGPSRFSPFTEIGYSLADLTELVRARIAQCRERGEDASAVETLERALVGVMDGIPAVQKSLMDVPAAHEAWRRIAPGVDLVARKPLGASRAISLPTIDPNPVRRHGALERELAAMNGTSAPTASDAWRTARRNGLGHYARELRTTLRDQGARAALGRVTTLVKKLAGISRTR